MQGWLDAIFCSISPENPVAACTTQGIEIQSMLHDGRKKGNLNLFPVTEWCQNSAGLHVQYYTY